MDDLESLAGPALEVTQESLEECRQKGQFGALVFELYKEIGRLVTISTTTSDGHIWNEASFGRNQAICAGLLVRMSKLMLSVAKLSASVEHGETIQALNRCILESAINLLYLLHKDDEGVYDKFVKSSLMAERELSDMIRGSIEARGGELLGIEQNMLRSIDDTFELSGVTAEEVNPGTGNWGGSFRDKLTTLGFDWRAYTVLERMPSHYIHGDWVDLVKNHLLLKDDGYFEPKLDHLSTDGELLGPVAVIVITATREYLNNYFEQPDVDQLHQRLHSAQERLLLVEYSREDWQVVE